MAYEAKNFGHILGIKGLSDQLLNNHFTLYQGYVTNTNKLDDILGKMRKEGQTDTPEYSELKRRFGWEFNGMRLHEYYFGGISKTGRSLDESTNLYKRITKDFGSYEDWEKDFRSIAAIRGIGWIILSFDMLGERLFNTWINEHDVGHLSGSIPILVMDVFEHAFMLDYGVKRVGYINAYFDAINWSVDPKLDKILF